MSHWFVICVFFQNRTIKAYDTAPYKKIGRLSYVKAVLSYLKAEYKANYGVNLPDEEDWKLVPCGLNQKKIAPRQNETGNNCGVFTCLMMEMLVNKIDPWVLNDYRTQVEEKGRMALFHSIKSNKPILQNCFCPSELTLQNCNNGPYKVQLLFPLTSVFINKGKLPYIEELSYHFSDSSTVVKGTNQGSLPEPCPFWFHPPCVNDGVIWSYDETSRIVIANCSNVRDIHWRHKQYIGQLMERDDVTLIMEGLVSNLASKIKDLNLLMKELRVSFGEKTYHNFRIYRRVQDGSVVTYKPAEKFVTPMKVKDYVRYLNTLMGENPDHLFSYVNDKGREIKFKKATDVVLYMLDIDMTHNLLNLNAAFNSEFKMKEILPGGKWCMLNQIGVGSRTFMGPNFYVSPGKSSIVKITDKGEISYIQSLFAIQTKRGW